MSLNVGLAPGASGNRWLLLSLKAAVTAAILIAVVSTMDLGAVPEAWRKLSLGGVSVAVLLMLLQLLLAGVRWVLVLRALDVSIPRDRAFKIYLIGAFFNQVLPTSVGGDAMRMYYLYRHLGKRTDSAIAVLLDRFFGLLSLAVLCGFTLTSLWPLMGEEPYYLVLCVILGAAVAGTVVIATLDLLPIERRIWGVTEAMGAFSRTLRSILGTPGPVCRIMLLSVAIHGLSFLALYLLLVDLESGISLAHGFAVLPSIMLLAMMPVSIAGWGLREGAMVVGLSYFSIQPASALVASVVFGIILLMVGGVGGLVWICFASPGERKPVSSRLLE